MDIPTFLPGEEVPWDVTEYDEVQYGYRTPDGHEHFRQPLLFTRGGKPLNTVFGQETAQRAFEHSLRGLGIAYDPKIHGRLEFISRIISHRASPAIHLIPEED